MATVLKLPDLNTSGFTPYDTRCVVLPDPVQTKIGAIELPDSVVEKEKYAQTRGTLIAIGDGCFADWAPSAARPQAGDRIVYGRYAGNTHKGADGKDYTICNDEDILTGWSGN